MAVISNNTFFLKDVVITIGTDEYTSAFRDPALTPTAPEVTVVDASGTARPFVGKSSYRFTGVLYQDWTATGLAKAWQTGEGTQATIKYKLPGTQGVWTAIVVLKATQIGGNTNGVAEASVDLPVVGTPTWSAT